MIELMVWMIYASLILATVIVIKRTKRESFGFADGILVGAAYFLGIPLTVTFYTGVIYANGIHAAPYFPFIDINTTITIFIGWMVALLCSVLSKRWAPRQTQRERSDPIQLSRYWKIALAMYFALSIYSFAKSGIASGGHWHKTVSDNLTTSTSFVIIKNFSMALRVMIFGLIVHSTLSGKISKRAALIFGVIIVVFDMSVTLNRITAVFLIITIFILYSKKWPIVITSAIILVPFITEMSSVWPAFRGLVFTEGLSIDGVINAWDMAHTAMAANDMTIYNNLNSIFESSNIVVLNYVVNNFGDKIDYYYGSTFIGRPLTTFIPGTIWPDKPGVFGVDLGLYINNYPGLALNSTLLGEPVGNFGILWPLFLAGFILFMDWIYTALSPKIAGLRTMSFFVAIAIWRFDANFASVGIYTSVLMLIAYQLFPILSETVRRPRSIR